MNDSTVSRCGEPISTAAQQAALSAATSVIPPSWPLDRLIAVNPWWDLRHLPAERAVDVPGARVKTSMLMPTHFYRDAWKEGRIREPDILAAISESGTQTELNTLLATLDREPVDAMVGAPLMLDQAFVRDAIRPIHTVRQQVAQACGLFFDLRQSRWLVDIASQSLFESWLEQTQNDLMLDRRTGLVGARSIVRGLANEATTACEWAIDVLKFSANDLQTLAQRLLFELVGWASWCKGVDWRSALEGGQSKLCDQLLTVLLVWEAIAVQLASPERRHQWHIQWREYQRASLRTRVQPLWIWHRAYELGYQRSLIHTLIGAGSAPRLTPTATATEFQAVFCIDVRSEVMRRHLEEACPTAQTLGFAGFFGMPVTQQGLGPESETPRLPGLLAPAYRLADSTGDHGEDQALQKTAYQRERARQTVRKAKYSSLSSFTLVETTGLAWAWKLTRDSLNLNRVTASSSAPLQSRLFHRYGGDPVSDNERVDLAEQLLRGMSLTSGFASLLVFVGHGTHTDNNPHHAGLACGACGGQNGGINASLAARLINDPVVRSGLAERGIRIPDFTYAIAAEHCTVTDRVSIMDRNHIPDAYIAKLVTLENGFAEAAKRTRRERAGALNLDGLDDETLLHQMTKRTVNWAEPRPEWGLANNASIVFAKRTRTKGLDFAGRMFLHDYDASLDSEGNVLKSLMTAPMIVANWINLQYLGSVAAPDTFGAGNKLLHSVIGGNVGVIEGNDPDLRIGLSHQSVHDGQRWRHEPLRLSVFIDAPRSSIDRVIAEQPDVAALVENRWLWLFRFAEDGIEQYLTGDWRKW
nr:DUF2309 domain-containing protein [uncultured Halomonas sp.]